MSPFNHRQGREPTHKRTADAMSELCIFSGGVASGPARSESEIIVKISMAAEMKAHIKLETTDSGIGYITMDKMSQVIA